MNARILFFSLVALTAAGFASPAHASEPARHNDLDGDGRSDLIWRNASTGAIMYWSHAAATSPRQVTVDQSGAGFDLRRMSPILTKGEGPYFTTRGTLLVRDPVSGQDFDLSAHGASTSYLAYGEFGDGDWKAVGAGDFDGNGTSDVIYRNFRDGRNFRHGDAVWADWSGIWPVAPVNLAWVVAGIGDFDGDSRSDILWRNPATGQNAIWRSGDVTTQLHISAVTSPGWQIAAVGDFNGDGRSDILWRNTLNGSNVIWKSGNILTPQAVASVTDQRWQVAATGDFNGDGKWDLFWRHSAAGGSVIWLSANRATSMATPALSLSWSPVM